MQASKRRDRLTGEHLKQYEEAVQWAALATNNDLTVPALQAQATKNLP